MLLHIKQLNILFFLDITVVSFLLRDPWQLLGAWRSQWILEFELWFCLFVLYLSPS